ncbi:MAG: LCP family protein [Bifidobacteriaceae bacterium]|nr:LCP family protein [Bifidobacteriaceae bacterium]
MHPRHAANRPPQPPKHRLKIARRSPLAVVGALVAASVLAGGVAAAERLRQLDSNLTVLGDVDELIDSDDRPERQATTSAEPAPLDPFGGQAVNILITAIDSRDGENADVVQDAMMGTLSNDVNMVAHISADRSRVDVVALPRDTFVEMPSCKQPNGHEVGPARQVMLNNAFLRGSASDVSAKNEGVACIVKTIESVTDIRLDSFILVDFAGFANVIDALDGVDICLPDGLKSQKAHLDLPRGQQHLDGQTALQFARARDPRDADGKSLSDGSDVQRISHQQQLIATVINEVLASGNLQSLPKLNTTATAITKSLYVGEDLGSVVSLAGLAYALRDIKLENVSLFTIPWAQAQSDSNRVVLAEYGSKDRFGGLGATEIFALIATDRPVPGTIPYKLSNPEPASDAASPDPADPSAAGTPGAAPETSTDAAPTADEEFVTPVDAPVTCQVEGAGSTG